MTHKHFGRQPQNGGLTEAHKSTAREKLESEFKINFPLNVEINV